VAGPDIDAQVGGDLLPGPKEVAVGDVAHFAFMDYLTY
jgi:hypothetical protein